MASPYPSSYTRRTCVVYVSRFNEFSPMMTCWVHVSRESAGLDLSSSVSTGASQKSVGVLVGCCEGTCPEPPSGDGAGLILVGWCVGTGLEPPSGDGAGLKGGNALLA